MRNKERPIELKGDTIVEQFEFYLGEHRKISDIVNFLAIQNDRLLATLSEVENQDPTNLPVPVKEQIMDFVSLFDNDYDHVTRAARILEWGPDDALILRAADVLFEEELYNDVDGMLGKMSPAARREVETLTDTIYQVKKDRFVFFVYGDYSTDYMTLPKKIFARDLKYSRYELMERICKAVLTYGYVLVREFRHALNTGASELYGFEVKAPFGVWGPLDEKDLLERCLTTDSGIALEPEDDVAYVCRPRELF